MPAVFDRFDIATAHYAFNADYHGGQWSPEYRRLCRIGKYFDPGHGSHPPHLSSGSNCREIYLALERAWRQRNVAKIRAMAREHAIAARALGVDKGVGR